MKIGIFADSHYCKEETLCFTRKPSLSLVKIKEMLAFFKKESVDLCLCLGDVIDKFREKSEALKYILRIKDEINSSGIPYLAIQGNHDCNNFSAAEFYALMSTPSLPFVYETETHNFVFIDGNYRSSGRSFYEEGVEWTDSNVPRDQVEFLKISLDKSEKPCVVVLHENLDPTVQKDHIVKNAEEIRCIAEQSGKVDLVLQGHYHSGSDTTLNDIRYVTVPAMCEGKENRFIILDLNTMQIHRYSI